LRNAPLMPNTRIIPAASNLARNGPCRYGLTAK
jgi:hypothetical protein